MFGFGKSKEKFRGEVDIKLNNEYQIITNNSVNDKFPGVLSYVEMIDVYIKSGWNVDEAAMGIAMTYYCGLFKHKYMEEAENLYKSMERIVEFGLSKGLISRAKWDNCLKIIAREKDKLT